MSERDAIRTRLEARWHELLDHADESDDSGDHIGWARYYRAKADGLAEAMQLLDSESHSNPAEDTTNVPPNTCPVCGIPYRRHPTNWCLPTPKDSA